LDVFDARIKSKRNEIEEAVKQVEQLQEKLGLPKLQKELADLEIGKQQVLLLTTGASYTPPAPPPMPSLPTLTIDERMEAVLRGERRRYAGVTLEKAVFDAVKNHPDGKKGLHVKTVMTLVRQGGYDGSKGTLKQLRASIGAVLSVGGKKGLYNRVSRGIWAMSDKLNGEK
jgi:hypothetical protein